MVGEGGAGSSSFPFSKSVEEAMDAMSASSLLPLFFSRFLRAWKRVLMVSGPCSLGGPWGGNGLGIFYVSCVCVGLLIVGGCGKDLRGSGG